MTLIDQILHSPRMVQYAETLKEVIAEERAAREKFYDELREDQKAEFINGRVVVHSPVRYEHEDASTNLVSLLRAYVREHGLGHVAHEKLLVCLTRNDYEPDICFWRREISAAFVKGQMKFPAPDLVVEVLSPTTKSNDRGVKFEDFAAHGVREYWIVDADICTIEQYRLEGDVYQLVVKVQEGVIRSIAIAGLEIPAQAAFDASLNQKTLKAILAGTKAT